MSNTEPAPGEQPTPPDNFEVDQQPTDYKTEIGTLDQANLARALYPDSEALPPETKPPASEELADDEVPPAPGDKSPKPPQRLSARFMTAEQQQETADAFALVREHKAPDLLTALQQIRGISADQAPAAESYDDFAPDPVVPLAEIPSEVATIQDQIAELRVQRTQAKEDYDNAEEDRLTAQIEDLGVELAEARVRTSKVIAEKHAEEVSYDTSYQKSVDAMEAKYPWTLDETSPLYQKLDDMVTLAIARKSPDLNDPNYILEYAERVAKSQNSRAPVPPADMRLRGAGVAPGTSGSVEYTKEQGLERIEAADLESLGAALFRS